MIQELLFVDTARYEFRTKKNSSSFSTCVLYQFVSEMAGVWSATFTSPREKGRENSACFKRENTALARGQVARRQAVAFSQTRCKQKRVAARDMTKRRKEKREREREREREKRRRRNEATLPSWNEIKCIIRTGVVCPLSSLPTKS